MMEFEYNPDGAYRGAVCHLEKKLINIVIIYSGYRRYIIQHLTSFARAFISF